MRFTDIVAGALAANIAAAHPGHDHSKEMAQRREFLGAHGRRGLAHCADKLRARGVEARAVKRRAQLAKATAQKRGLKVPRDLSDYINIDHESSENYDLSTPYTTLFSGNNSCVLSPEVTEGPYYVAGEYIRTNINDDETGVDMTVDAQVIDVNTCDPVPDAYVEIWHCNSTGVYSGVVASGNGNSNDQSNLDATFHRGVQLTDSDGVVNFETMFPGHYTGRTTHIHVMVHLNAEAQANGTLIDTTAAHVGQMFFDQDLISEVEATSPYSSNSQSLTTNTQDSILSEEAETSDPFMEYVKLGNSVEDGLLAWLAFGIDTSYSREVSAAATLTEDGGVAGSGSGSGSGGGSGGPGGMGGGGPQ